MNFYLVCAGLIIYFAVCFWCLRLSYRRGVRDGRFKTNYWWIAVGYDVEQTARSRRSEQID